MNIDPWTVTLAAVVLAAIMCGIAYRIPPRHLFNRHRLRDRENGRER